MSDEKMTIVTDDKAMLEDGQVSETDRKILNGETGFIKLESVDQLLALANMAKHTYDAFHDEIKPKMTPERAARVKALRCPPTDDADMHSWRSLAEVCHGEWGADATWSPPWNQLAGMALCELAAKLLGENHREPPWN